MVIFDEVVYSLQILPIAELTILLSPSTRSSGLYMGPAFLATDNPDRSDIGTKVF